MTFPSAHLIVLCSGMLVAASISHRSYEPPKDMWLEIPSQGLHLQANDAAIVKPEPIPLVNLHLGRQPEDVAYAKISIRLNAEVANIVTTQHAGEDGIICTLDLATNPAFLLRPGRNSVEVSYLDRRSNVFYSSFMLQLPSTSSAPASRRSAGVPAERPIASGRRFAVVIGVGKYKSGGSGLQNLPYADSDAASFQQFLIHAGAIPQENVHLLLNNDATLENVRQAITHSLTEVQPSDTVILYMNMQGAYDPIHPDRKFLLPYDTDPNDMSNTALPVADIPGILAESINTKHIIVFADTCHGNGIGTQVTIKTKPDNLVNLYLVRALQLQGFAAIEASDIHQVSHDGKQWNDGGAFTHALIQGLGGKADLDGDGTVTVDELFHYTQLLVAKETFDEQLPILADGHFGNLAIAGLLATRKAGQAHP